MKLQQTKIRAISVKSILTETTTSLAARMPNVFDLEFVKFIKQTQELQLKIKL